MFIDYLTLIMINLVAGLVLLAFYLWKGILEENQRPYAIAFFGVGLISLVTGLHISLTWPIPGAYNISFGESTTLFGIVYLMAAVALWKGWSLLPVAIYAFFAGVYAVIAGARIYSLQVTKAPLLSALGFILGGLAGVGAAPYLAWFKNNKVVRILGILVILGAATIWFATFTGSLWGHMESFGKWVPAAMSAAGK